MKYLIALCILVLPIAASAQVSVEAMGVTGFGVYAQQGYKPVTSAFVGANIPLITKDNVEAGNRTVYFYTDRLNPEVKGVTTWIYAKKRFPWVGQNWSTTVGMGVIFTNEKEPAMLLEGGWQPGAAIEVGGGFNYIPLSEEKDAFNLYLLVNLYP